MLATFDLSVGAIANLSIKISIASGSTLEIPTSAATVIGEAVKAVDSGGSLDGVQTAAAGDEAIGLVSRASNAGGNALVTAFGRSWGIANEAIAIGNNLAPTANGQLKIAAGTEPVIAKALAPATASGELFEVLVK